MDISKTVVKSSTKNYFIENLSRKSTDKSYMLEGKRAEKNAYKMSQNAYIASRNVPNM